MLPMGIVARTMYLVSTIRSELTTQESNLLALRVHDIQRRLYDEHMKEYGRPPPAVPLPDDASWAPL